MKRMKNSFINWLENKDAKIEKYIMIFNFIFMITGIVILVLPIVTNITIILVLAIALLLLYFNYFFYSIKKVKVTTLRKNKLVYFLLANVDFHFANLFLIETIILSKIFAIINMEIIFSKILSGIAVCALYIAIIVVDLKLSEKIAKYFQKKIIK